MVSNSIFTKRRRALKAKKAGKDRKRKLRVQGTTPSFPLDPEEKETAAN